MKISLFLFLLFFFYLFQFNTIIKNNYKKKNFFLLHLFYRKRTTIKYNKIKGII